MRIENQFVVTAPPAEVWEYLQNVEGLVPCMPGAELLETVDDQTWRGRMKVKLGPVGLNFEGTVERPEVDHEQHWMRLRGSGKDRKGRGSASAHVEVSVAADIDVGSQVTIVQDLKIQGQIAQFGRGMMQDISAQMTDQFASCLEARMSAAPVVATMSRPEVDAPNSVARSTAPGAPVNGLRLLIRTLVRALKRAVRRFVTRSTSPDERSVRRNGVRN